MYHKHPNITWENIQNNPDKEWCWYYISLNPNITWDIIQNNPDKDWHWPSVSEKSKYNMGYYRKKSG